MQPGGTTVVESYSSMSSGPRAPPATSARVGDAADPLRRLEHPHAQGAGQVVVDGPPGHVAVDADLADRQGRGVLDDLARDQVDLRHGPPSLC